MRRIKEIPTIWLSDYPERDDGEVIARVLTDFLLHYTNQIIYQHCALPESSFDSTSFNGLLLKKCLEPRVKEYIDRLRRTLERWLSHQRMFQFTLLFVDNTGVVAEFQVNFFEPREATRRRIHGISKHLVELKRQLRDVLFDLQRATDVPKFDEKELTLKVLCSVVEETSHIDRDQEHSWVWVHERIRRSNKELNIEPLTRNVSCTVAEIKFLNYVSEAEESPPA